MNINFSGFFARGNKWKDEKTNIVKQVDDMQLKIVSDTIKVSFTFWILLKIIISNSKKISIAKRKKM